MAGIARVVRGGFGFIVCSRVRRIAGRRKGGWRELVGKADVDGSGCE